MTDCVSIGETHTCFSRDGLCRQKKLRGSLALSPSAVLPAPAGTGRDCPPTYEAGEERAISWSWQVGQGRRNITTTLTAAARGREEGGVVVQLPLVQPPRALTSSESERERGLVNLWVVCTRALGTRGTKSVVCVVFVCAQSSVVWV